ncbi:EAL and HDOD domain-containing protein [Colwellia sp. 12G3]|uniref:EAL and HDOD domain-containing protein n=1 Tax=Colwellia sp. 12G3 TaxID=2058299 RepID=UPI000C33B4B5|nr:EAL domain-containing protein [Colwellia sp. 12G3]PKI13522.1 diguanylate phosphodiesterase [Colwellia sp. 12G3]
MTEAVKVKFVARQAILDRNENVFAYELLYRNSNDNFFPINVSDDEATARIFFDSLLFFGIENLADNKKLFINLSTSSILSSLPKLIEPHNVVLEIVERTNRLDEVLHHVENLMKNQYVFALDDYGGDPKWDNLLKKVKYIKLEVEENLQHTLKRISSLKAAFPNKIIIVERIEDYESFALIKKAGADLFQGYYFTKPKLLNFKNVNPSQLTTLDLLKITLKTPLDFDALINKVEKDAALVVRLLRLSNLRCKSANKKISSISQAVIYLGEDTIKQFVTVLALGDLGENKPSELLKLGLIRARFIELLLNSDKKLRCKGYLLGIVSICNALIDVDLALIYKELSLSIELQEALNNQTGKLGFCFDLCLKIENSDFIGIEESQKKLGLDETFIMNCYAQALTFADKSLI